METPEKLEIIREIKKLSNKIDKLRQMFQEESKKGDRLITVQEAAKILGVSEYTIRQEIRAGNLKAQRPKNARAYRLSYCEIIKLISS